MMKIIVYISLFLLSISCNRNDGKQETSFLDNIKTEDAKIMTDIIHLKVALKLVDILSLKGLTIHFRSIGEQPFTHIYFLFKNDLECSPYMIVYSSQFNRIIEIDNSLVIKFGCEDFIDRSRINYCMYEYLKLKVCYMRVDNFGNIYFNVSNQEKPNLLRVNDNSELPNDILEFRQVYDVWFVRK